MGERGEAGRRGDDVRSDIFVAVELTSGGGLVIELESKVEPYFGDQIREQARVVLGAFGVDNARVEMRDTGAVPFVIEARLEAAVRAAGVARAGDVRPDGRALGEGSDKNRLRRSRLYLPGNEPKFMLNAGLFSPDGVILDLEDSVHPQAKSAARLLVRNALRCVDFRGAERMVRINQLPLGLEDLDAVVPEAPDVILIPKADTAEQVREVDDRIEKLHGRERNLWLMPILESSLGVENAFAIATASDRVCALTIGLEDYTADLGVVKTKSGGESHYARTRLVNAARAAGVQAIDSVFGDVADMEGLRAWGEAARAIGFEGMGCIHPRQIRVIHEAFAPTSVEIDKALRVVRAFEDAEARGLGVVSLGSKMIDPPVVERARRLVARARAMGACPEPVGGAVKED